MFSGNDDEGLQEMTDKLQRHRDCTDNFEFLMPYEMQPNSEFLFKIPGIYQDKAFSARYTFSKVAEENVEAN